MRIDFEGRLDEGVLAKAVECSCATLPLIACGFDAAPWAWHRWVPRREAAREVLRVVEAQGRLEEEAHRAFGGSLDIERGPQLRLVLIRDAQRDSLCVLINHMLCDATGFKQYVGVLARLYSRLAEALEPSPPPFCPKRSIWPVMRGFTPKEWLQAVCAKPKAVEGRVEGSLQGSGPAGEESPFEILTASVPAEGFARIRVAAKARGFTVNDVFLGALGLAWHRMTGTRTLVLPCSLDMRRFAPPQAPIGITNLASTCICYAEVPPEGTIEDIMMQVVDEMSAYRGGIPGLRQLIRWAVFSRLISLSKMDAEVFATFDRCDVLSSSNMGVIDEECVSFAAVPVQAAYLLLSTIPAPAFTVGMSTFRNTPTFSLCVRGDDEARGFIKEVFTLFMEELMRFGAAEQQPK
jgi:NRPS condensation-like uncharacterized protein